MSRTRLPLRVWCEVGVSFLAVGLTVLTIADPEWIETFFHVEPDEGAGWLELFITLGAAFVALASAALAARDYRRTQSGRPEIAEL